MTEIRRATPILFTDAIEPLLDLWDRLGFIARRRFRTERVWAS